MSAAARLSHRQANVLNRNPSFSTSASGFQRPVDPLRPRHTPTNFGGGTSEQSGLTAPLEPAPEHHFTPWLTWSEHSARDDHAVVCWFRSPPYCGPSRADFGIMKHTGKQRFAGVLIDLEVHEAADPGTGNFRIGTLECDRWALMG